MGIAMQKIDDGHALGVFRRRLGEHGRLLWRATDCIEPDSTTTIEAWGVNGRPIILVVHTKLTRGKYPEVSWELYRPLADTNRFDLTLEALDELVFEGR